MQKTWGRSRKEAGSPSLNGGGTATAVTVQISSSNNWKSLELLILTRLNSAGTNWTIATIYNSQLLTHHRPLRSYYWLMNISSFMRNWDTLHLFNLLCCFHISQVAIFLADRTNGRAIATLLCLSVCRRLSVALCIVAKRCVLEQKLLWRAYRKSYMRNRLVPKWMTLTFV